MRRVAFVLLVVAAFGGVIGHAQLQTGGPATFVGGGSLHLPNTFSISADRVETKTLGTGTPGRSSESASFQGNVTVSQNGAIVKADEATFIPATQELQLRGNVRMVLSPLAAPAK